MTPEVGKLRALAARKAKEVKKVNLSNESVWDLNCNVATWMAPSLGWIG